MEALREAWSAILVNDYDSTHVAIIDDAIQVLSDVDVKALREAAAMDVTELTDWRHVDAMQDLARQVLAALWVGADDDAASVNG